MSIQVFKTHILVDGTFFPEGKSSKHAKIAVGLLAALGEHPLGDGPRMAFSISLEEKGRTATVTLQIESFMSTAEYQRSLESPLSFAHLEVKPTTEAPNDERCTMGWLFRDALYVTDRPPSVSEVGEVEVRIKALHFQSDESLKRLKEKVANFEAIERNLESPLPRRQIAEDVKLLVWTRDGGACVKCGFKTGLHFDHIIPLSRGGGDQAENIQLLCRTCNLTKGSRLI